MKSLFHPKMSETSTSVALPSIVKLIPKTKTKKKSIILRSRIRRCRMEQAK